MTAVRLDRPRPAFTVAGPGAGAAPTGPIVTTAIHAGHDLRPELADLVGVDDTTRQREEDPSTDRLAARGPFVVLDIHSCNHRRAGIPASDADCPELNLGTGSLDRRRWAHVVDGFLHEMGTRHVAGHPVDVRENVVFEGRYLAEWVHRRYPDRGCALALDFKKIFMDEWTGRADDRHIAELGRAIAGVAARLSDLVTREAA